MQAILNALSDHTRQQLQHGMHKVAAVMVQKEGVPLSCDEITLKEASFVLGFKFWKQYLEKRAVLDGIMSTMRLSR
jgi:hypothetical protein